MSMPPTPPVASANAPTAEELRTAHSAFAACHGTYTLDVGAQTVTIHVEGGDMPSYIRSGQVRPFRIQGDNLILGIPGRY